MSYEKHTWETGETITAEKLNNLEDGVASGSGSTEIFVLKFYTEDLETVTADKSFEQLLEAYNSGKQIVAYINVYNEVSKFPTFTKLEDNSFIFDVIGVTGYQETIAGINLTRIIYNSSRILSIRLSANLDS